MDLKFFVALDNEISSSNAFCSFDSEISLSNEKMYLITKFGYQMKFANFRNSIFGPKVSQKSRSDPSLCDKPAVIIVSNLPATACISSASRL